MFNHNKNSFEVGFYDKYLQCLNNLTSYEMRYSFSPITSANWSSAIPVHVIPRSGFNNTDNYNGRITKNSECYQRVWAEFKLSDVDQLTLNDGEKIYFAVKDVSQLNGNEQTPAIAGKGRNYAENPENFDYASDQAALLLIKRFDYIITSDSLTTDTAPPAAPINVSVQ